MLTRSKLIKRKCHSCGKRIDKLKRRIKMMESVEESEFYSIRLSQTLNIGDIICDGCRIKACKNKYKSIPSSSTAMETHFISGSETDFSSDHEDKDFTIRTSQSVNDSAEKISLPIQRTVSTHRYCCLCRSKNDLKTIPDRARIQAFTSRKIYIPEGNRCCNSHLIKDRFYESELVNLTVHSNSSELRSTEVCTIFQVMTTQLDLTLFKQIINKSISEEQIYILTGLNWTNLIHLESMIRTMRNNSKRTIMQALVVFFTKLRTGNSNRLLSTVLGIKSYQVVSEYCSSVIDAFEKDILPQNFGLNSQNRQWLIDNHTSKIAQKLYNIHNQLILICDGTYAYHQKSMNNEFQRRSFSVQKKAHLLKPFTICTTTGYIIDMLGPFPANQNDAEILRNLIDSPYGLCNLLQKGDVFVLDRGFRDVVDHIREKGYKVLMPALKGRKKQLTTEEANESRFVTKIRWTVEAVHGLLKVKNKLLNDTFDNKMLPKIKSYYRIASYSQNAFGKGFNTDDTITEQMIQRMMSKKNDENHLAKCVEDKGWLRKKLPFQSIHSCDVTDFPELSEMDLKILFTGTYQFGQAISYLAEMMLEDGSINIQYVKDHSNILKLKVQSRHISKRVYQCFIEYVPDHNSIDAIKGYYCECANGLRTVGCCSHNAAVIYYLSYGRFLSNIPKPSEKLSKLISEDLCITINDDSDED